MASASKKNSCSLWDRLAPDLQDHIYGLAVEQCCRELMRTQVCPGIILAAIKKSQASFELVPKQIVCELMAGGDAQALGLKMNTIMRGFQGALNDAMDAFLSSIAGLPRHMRCMWMRQVRDVLDDQESLIFAFRRRRWRLSGHILWCE
jgi:hypothetical protein